MVEKIAKKIGKNTIVRCKEFELIEGNLNNDIWLLEINNEIRVALKAEEYLKEMELLKKSLKENFELKLEKAILSEFPIDYDDVKAVVLEEMKKDKDASIDEVVNRVKLEHPNLFYNLELDKIF
ncbi:MAG: DUF2603 domain-containing protein [Nautiliaceae bacterium]